MNKTHIATLEKDVDIGSKERTELNTHKVWNIERKEQKSPRTFKITLENNMEKKG